jgi:hypothetical protein
MRVQQHLPTADSEEYFLIEDEESARQKLDIRSIDGTVTKCSKT